MSGLGEAAGFLADPLDLFGQRAAREARELGESAAETSTEEIRRQFDVSQEMLQPFAEQAVPALQLQGALAGGRGLEAQSEAFRQFEESPATQFLRESGLKMASNNLDPGIQAALSDYSQGLALQDYGDYFNRLGAVAGTGQASQLDLAGLGEQAAGDIVRQQQQQFSAQQQGLAAQQAAQSNFAQQGLGLAAAFGGGSGRQQPTSSGFQSGVPINQANYGGYA